MLITLCYSVLTWIQSRHRQEVGSWVEDVCVKEKATLVFIRDDSEDDFNVGGSSCSSRARSRERSRERSTSRDRGSGPVSRSQSHDEAEFSRGSFNSGCSSSVNFMHHPNLHGSVNSLKQVSDLCYTNIKGRKLIFQEDRTKALALFPLQIVDLHGFTAFHGTKIENFHVGDENGEQNKFYILLEAEPGAIQRENYRQFSKFGEITAWKCGLPELALILLSELNQLIDLMHIFRLGKIILDGGWRVHRLTTVAIEGTFGTLIRNDAVLPGKKSSTLTPGDLHRLSAGIFETRDRDNRDTPTGGTPKNSLSKDTSKHDIATINEELSVEEALEDDDNDTLKRLPNWYDRSPKKRSIATIANSDKQVIGRRRVGSFCSGTLSSGSKSSSLASLLLCAKSMSVEEEDSSSCIKIPYGSKAAAGASSSFQQQSQSQAANRQQSFENVLSPTISNSVGASPKINPPVDSNGRGKSCSQTNSAIQSPCCENPNILIGGSIPPVPGPNGKPFKSFSAFSSPKKTPNSLASHGGSGMIKRTPNRLGKPPNILVLCEDSKKRGEIASILKSMLANDRYAIYDIRWNQLAVGGWADQTALLVVSGKIPDSPTHIPTLLQFLGDGGKLFAWCCENPPFGPQSSSPEKSTGLDKQKCVLNYGASQTHALSISPPIWGVAKEKELPTGIPRILETNDSEGYSRPLTSSVFARVKDSNETAIVQLDGGALGGKAVLSRVNFEDAKEEESSLALLSILLSQNLGIDCTRIKSPEYTHGYLLGDHKRVQEFLSSVPTVVQQSNLTIEWVPRGEKGSKPSHERLPVKTLECPPNFSTLDYYNNLTTKDLGRIVIYTDVITSAMHVFNGHSLKNGLVVVARRQTAGRGRGKNIWLSPEGCVSLTTQIDIKLDSQLGRRLPLIQHIAALSVVLSVSNHKEINLRLKWPNDIYLNEQKIGGVLTETRIEGKTATAIIGIGVNLSNDHPTVCLNSVLGDKEKISSATLVAKCLSQMESLLDSIEAGGIQQVLASYTDNWIHNLDDVVNVEVSGGNYAECQISGVDEFGFLRVTDVNSGHVFSVGSDGNSFDITNKLIAIKE